MGLSIDAINWIYQENESALLFYRKSLKDFANNPDLPRDAKIEIKGTMEKKVKLHSEIKKFLETL